MTERTLSIIKPDAVAKNVIGEIYSRFEKAGLQVVAARMVQLSRADAEGFYAVHKERPFFKDLVEFMISGPVMVQALEGEGAIAKNRDLMGATNPKEAAAGTIRADFADSIDANAVHGSDSAENAKIEIDYFFGEAAFARAPNDNRNCTMTETARSNLLGMDRPALEQWFSALGEQPFRARQLMQWVYQRSEARFEEMTDIAKPLRLKLAEVAEIRTPELITEQLSTDGTRKWLLKVDSGNAVEVVFIPEADRGTLCISSQVGCAMDCQFCATGAQGFSRNLTAAEILGQVWFAQKALNAVPREQRVISNVVFMGMGEPLANFDHVVTAVNVLLDDLGYGLSKRRVTVSTSGLVPFMDRLHDTVDTALAVSLHAPNDVLRDEIVPINKKYPLQELMAACRRYTAGKERQMHIVYEYVMLQGVNDKPEHARALAKLLVGMPAKVNLIPFNPYPGSRYTTSRPEAVSAFSDILRKRGVVSTTRKTRGDDIDAACGQLVGQVKSRQKNRLSGIPITVQPS